MKKQITSFRLKLLKDFTLFELSDPKTLNHYLEKMDYLIENFFYFKDIDLVANYFVGNEVFLEKFNIEKFIYILTKSFSPPSDNDIFGHNSMDTIFKNYGKVILCYFHKYKNIKLFNRALNNIINNIKKQHGSAKRILLYLAAKLILINIKKINMEIFINTHEINIKIISILIKLIVHDEKYKLEEVLMKSLTPKFKYLLHDFITIGLNNGELIQCDNVEEVNNNPLVKNMINLTLNTDKSYYLELFSILKFGFENNEELISQFEFPLYELKGITLYTQYYLRIMSFCSLNATNSELTYLVQLMFSNENNSYLLSSILGILRNKKNALFLKNMHSMIKDYIENKIHNLYLCLPIQEQLYSHLIKLYKGNMSKEEHEAIDIFVLSKITDAIPVCSIFIDTDNEASEKNTNL
ncbi:hypothetical protein EBI_24326 [Enterocytozoon bieneusi H348]|nr:hypothetical protein EBI_24326 [Enterocytozoon bieneusi H348]|eukprot:XP_002649828.1 hypothetical protein EBI_24326 [Enterocytozoon bieneusi H348]